MTVYQIKRPSQLSGDYGILPRFVRSMRGGPSFSFMTRQPGECLRFFFCFSVFPSSLTPPLLRFFENFERVTSPDYLPTRRDVLYSRVKTTGISETVFEIGQTLYRVHDVGGARSERRKWHYCFENVSTIIYTVALSDYDGVLMEDESQVLCHQQTPTPPSEV